MQASSVVARRQFAFLKRGILLDAGHKASFVMSFAQTLVPLMLFFFVAKLVNAESEAMQPYGADYFGFVCIGFAMNLYFSRTLAACGSSIHFAQVSGVLEALLATRTPPMAIVVHDGIYQFMMGLMHVVIVLLCSVAIFDLDLQKANWLAACAGFVLASLVFLGLSSLSAAIVLQIKDGDPLQMFIAWSTSILAGAYFPVTLLPEWSQTLASLLPMTHALEVARVSLLRGGGLEEVSDSLLVLAIMALAILPSGLWIFAQSVKRARREGSVGRH